MPPRTRGPNCWLVPRWAPAAARRPKAPARLRSRHPGQGAPLDVGIEAPKQAKRGTAMAAGAKRIAPVTDPSSQGPQDVCGIRVCRGHVLPYGSRLSRQPEDTRAWGQPGDTTPQWAAHRMRACQAPAGVKVIVRFAAADLGAVVVPACRDQSWRVASTLPPNRPRFTPRWQLTAGRDGRPLWRRRRTAPRVITKPPARGRDCMVEAGGLDVSTLGKRPGGFARPGTEKNL